MYGVFEKLKKAIETYEDNECNSDDFIDHYEDDLCDLYNEGEWYEWICSVNMTKMPGLAHITPLII